MLLLNVSQVCFFSVLFYLYTLLKFDIVRVASVWPHICGQIQIGKSLFRQLSNWFFDLFWLYFGGSVAKINMNIRHCFLLNPSAQYVQCVQLHIFVQLYSCSLRWCHSQPFIIPYVSALSKLSHKKHMKHPAQS